MDIYFLLQLEPGVPEEALWGIQQCRVWWPWLLEEELSTSTSVQFCPTSRNKPCVEGRCPVCNVGLCLCLLCLNLVCYSDLWPLNNNCHIKGDTLATWNFYNLLQPGILSLGSVMLTVTLTKPKCKLLAASFEQPNSSVLTDMRH